MSLSYSIGNRLQIESSTRYFVVIKSLNRFSETVAAAFKPKQQNGWRKCAENGHESAEVMPH